MGINIRKYKILDTELSIHDHAEKSKLMKNPQWSFFSPPVTSPTKTNIVNCTRMVVLIVSNMTIHSLGGLPLDSLLVTIYYGRITVQV